MKYESMVFYRSFYEAIKGLPAETQGKIYGAVFAYGLDGEETELDGVEKAIFTLIKPQIDANNKRKEVGRTNGKKGGRPKQKEGEEKPKENQTETQQKPKENQKQSKPNANVNVNVNVNDIPNGISNTTKSKNDLPKHEPYLVEFDRLWKLYPRKEGRKEAMKAYERARKAGTTYETVKDGIDRYNEHLRREKTEARYIMQGSTFFRGERWGDTWESSKKTVTKFSNFSERSYDDKSLLGLIEM